MVWLASRACFSRALSSPSWKTLHHSPLATPSFGALSRQGSATSHFAGTGTDARWYFGPTVQPAAKTKTASPLKAAKCFALSIIVSWIPARVLPVGLVPNPPSLQFPSREPPGLPQGNQQG